MKTMTKSENRQKNASGAPENYVTPRVDITETREGYELRAEMPGVDKSALELVLDGNELTILGRRPAPPEKLELIYRESSPLELHAEVRAGPGDRHVEGEGEHGARGLVLQLPKAEQVKPRRIRDGLTPAVKRLRNAAAASREWVLRAL
jgi:HSP20 family protein